VTLFFFFPRMLFFNKLFLLHCGTLFKRREKRLTKHSH
jgi:hypothetical protein